MATRVAVRVIDGDGHIIEDMEGIQGFFPSPYREMARGSLGLVPPWTIFTRRTRSRRRPDGKGARPSGLKDGQPSWRTWG